MHVALCPAWSHLSQVLLTSSWAVQSVSPSGPASRKPPVAPFSIFFPSGADVGYLSLLDADYDKRALNRHFMGAVNYTLRFQWLRCLFWDQRDWQSGRSPPRAGTFPDRVNCRCGPLGRKGG